MAGNFGELVLVLGDVHIPERAGKISEKFQRMLVPNKMSHICITGNVGSYFSELQKLAPNVHVTQGDFDDQNYPETAVFNVGKFRIGMYHGHQILHPDRMRRKLQVDVLITGHTHESRVNDEEGYFHINPGSITGADSPTLDSVTASFILLAITDNKLSCYVYELVNGEVEVSKTEYVLPTPTNPDSNPALLDSLLH